MPTKRVFTLGIATLVCLGAHALDAANKYKQTDLVSDGAVKAVKTDPNLKNPWGLSKDSTTPWWVSDNATGLSTLYKANGAIVKSTVVTIQQFNGSLSGGMPSGTAFYNGTFVFATLDGTIQAWDGTNGTIIQVNNWATGASYTGCTVGKIGAATDLFVANANGGIEVYDSAYGLVTTTGSFTDPELPAGQTPYGIQAIGSNIVVTYSNGSSAAGNGWVTIYNTSGVLQSRLQSGTWFSDPWGVAMAPAKFGGLSHMLLIGNQANGQIDAFNPTTGAFVDYMRDSKGAIISNPGLWAIYFGGGNATNGPKTTLFFNAGINNYVDGLFGSFTAVK